MSMKNILYTIFLLIASTQVSGQNKQDYHWFFGGPTPLLEVNFNEQNPEFKIRTEGLDFDTNNVSISDDDGILLFYSNGCSVANAVHEVMPNGDSINAGPFFDEFWRDCKHGYPGRQDIIILKDPANSNGYYLLHKPIEYDPEANPVTFLQHIRYSYIDMNLDNGRGDVTVENEIFFTGDILYSYLTAINVKEKDDWWIIQAKRGFPNFYILKLTDSGLSAVDSFGISTIFHDTQADASGDAKFSPDGTKYAYFNKYDGLFLFDFDRDNGKLSNLKILSTSYPPDNFYISSVEFSPNSRFIYLAAHDTIWQVDTWEEDLQDGQVFIDKWDGVSDIFPTTFNYALLAPDCRIYVRPPTSAYWMHVINKPNEKGLACDFVQRAIRLPVTLDRGSFPNFPKFRVEDDEKCDPTITSIFGEEVYFRKDLQLSPNPTSDYLTISLPDNHSGRILVLTIRPCR